MSSTENGSRSLVQRAVITTDPQKAITEYFVSKQEERNIKKYPEWDIARVCPATEVIRAHRELAQVDEILKEKRAEQEKKRKDIDERWEETRKQELQLRQSFIKFNKLVRENVEKRERAEQKIKEEHERQEKRKQEVALNGHRFKDVESIKKNVTEILKVVPSKKCSSKSIPFQRLYERCQTYIERKEIDELEQKVRYMREVRNKMQHYVEEYKKFQNYLEKVVNETGEFQSINEIFNRYETLVEARQALSDHQDKNLQLLEEKGTEIHRLTEVRSQMLMELNNRLAQLQARYDHAKAQALKWETIVSRIKETAAAKHLELTQVKACCWNIYQQICKRKEIPIEVSSEDVEQQLVHIKRTILELKRIIKVAKKKAREEKGVSH